MLPVCLSCLVTVASAHEMVNNETPGRKIFFSKVEVFGGAGIAELRDNWPDDPNSARTNIRKLSHFYGVGLSKKISKRTDLTIRLFLGKDGGAYEENTFSRDASGAEIMGRVINDNSFFYYTLPVLMRYSPDRKSRLKIGGGPVISYLRRSILQTEHRFPDPNGATYPWQRFGIGYSDNTENCSKFNFSILGEISYSIPVTDQWALSVGLNHAHGFVDVMDPGLQQPYFAKTSTTSVSFAVVLSR